MEKKFFKGLRHEIQRGIDGKNSGIPMGFDRLNRYVSISKKIYTIIFGATGSGKSAFVHSAYILNPFDYYFSNKTSGIKVKFILFSMERSKNFTLAKWLSRKIFLDHGVLINVQKILGRWKDNKLSNYEVDLVDMYEDYMNELEEVTDIIEGSQNPTGIFNYCKEYALAHGKEEEIDQYHKLYTPDDENEIVIPIIDHLGLVKREKGMSTKKEAIDKTSEYCQVLRDKYGMSPVAVSQMNREKGSVLYKKMESFEPSIDDIKESGRPAEDSDLVISLFDPIRYATNDPDTRYDANKFQDPNTGAKYFRSIKILKNTYGEDDLTMRMAFLGATGQFKELPKANEMESFNYGNLFSLKYFLT